MCGNFTQYVCKCNLSIRFYNSDYFSLSIDTGLLSSIFKAYFTGIFICRTTDILIMKFYCIVQWIKPPSFIWNSDLLSTSSISPYNKLLYMWYFKISFLVRNFFVDLFWIDFIISSPLLFVNTIFHFYYFYWIILCLFFIFSVFYHKIIQLLNVNLCVF